MHTLAEALLDAGADPLVETKDRIDEVLRKLQARQ